MKEKFCIVAQGGGILTAYHAGVISTLKELNAVDKIDHIIASSGAATIYSYLVSKQEHFIEPIWECLMSSGKFINPLKHPLGKNILNIDFLIDTIKTKYSLNIKKLKNSPTKLEIGLTNVINGKPVFLSNKSSVDFFELIRATCAVPYFYGKSVCINGNHYYDGTIGSVCGIEQVTGEKNILLVLTRPQKPLRKMAILRKIMSELLISNETEELQQTIWSMVERYNNIPNVINKLSKNKHIVVIQPKNKLPVFRIDNRLDRVKRTIRQGYYDTINSKELKGFLNNLN